MGPKQLQAIDRWNLVIAAVAITVAALVAGRAMALGVAVGAVLSCANFYGIRRLWQAVLKSEGPGRVGLQLLLMGKMIGLMVFVFLAMKFLPLDPAGLAIGLSVFLLSIAAESMRYALTSSGRANTHG